MLCDIYIEALLAEAAQADGIWSLWDCGLIDGKTAARAWELLAVQLDSQRP